RRIALGLGSSRQSCSCRDIWFVLVFQTGDLWLVLWLWLFYRCNRCSHGCRNLFIRRGLVELLFFARLFLILLAEAVLQTSEAASQGGTDLALVFRFVIVLKLFVVLVVVFVGLWDGLTGLAEDLGAQGVGEERFYVWSVVGNQHQIQET